MTNIRTYPVSYVVSALPEGFPDASTWNLTVEMRGHNRWAVCWKGRVFSKSEARKKYPEGIFERRPSSRSDNFIRVYRFPLDEALKLAERIAPRITVMGMTPAQVLERHPNWERDE